MNKTNKPTSNRTKQLSILESLKPSDVLSSKLVKTKKYTNHDGVCYRDESWIINDMPYTIRYVTGSTNTTAKLMKLINWQAGQELYIEE